MRRPALPLLLLLLALAVPAQLRAESDADDDFRRAVAAARDAVYPALVNISVITRSFRGGRAVRNPSAGSGVIVSPSGHVLTNYHVAESATRLTCTLPDGERIDADVVTHDPLTDLSILKLRMEQRKDPTQPLPYAAIGDSDDLKVGDAVLAMGNPQTLSSSMTLGIVANTNRVFKSFTGSSLESLDLGGGQLTGILTRWIQHDALIQGGNSGGPLVNLKGEVVGINELGGGGMGFAIPSNLAKTVLSQALTFGEVRRGWLGVTVHPVEGLERDDGALIASTLPDGPLAGAGLQPGDVLLQVGRHPVSVRIFEDVPSFYAMVANLKPGTKQGIVYQRGNEQHTTEVTVALMEPFLGDERVFDVWGVSAMAITGPMAFSRHYPDTKGVVITGVRPGKPPEVARPSLDRGDVVTAIGGEAVESLDDFKRLQEKYADSSTLLVQFRRGQREMVTALDMTRKPPSRRGTELAKAWLGVQTQVMTPEVARALGLEDQRGFRVTWVLPGSAAEKAGLLAGDVITAIDGDKLDAYRLQDAELLRRRIEDMDIGADAELDVLREGKPIQVTVPLEETPSTASDAKSAKDETLEYSVREVTYDDKIENLWPLDTKGLIVTEVVNGGWANVSGLLGGDLILEIQDEAVLTIEAFEAMTKRIGEEHPKRIKIFVRRDVSTAFVFVEPDWGRD